MTVRSTTPNGSGGGTLSIVGIGPGLPAHLTAKARQTIRDADVVYAAELYQRFLRSGDVFPAADSDSRPKIVESDRGSLAELATESFEQVRRGTDVVHISGGDPNVYGKSDLLFAIADAEEVDDIDIEVIPGVTAALGGAAAVGAPLSNDFATVSLSDTWREWTDIEKRLRGATEAGFVLALYNCWRELDRAVATIREHRSEGVPVALLEDVGRGEIGRNPGGESVTLSTLGSVLEDAEEDLSPGTLAIVGTVGTSVIRTDHGNFLHTPRGDIDLEEI